ncbi:MAG: hypothetical protein CMM93_03690 [Rickettsiales bacterium]|nr:hypothetical protein [Rickettsiales bacterium]|tara:strand:+ start:396 stop:782 length:387 start_codon:yes stop_codon:yes gene_type:complete
MNTYTESQTGADFSENLNFAERIERLERLAAAMDSKWGIPGTSIRLGWDTVLGLIPGFGDTLTSGVSFYIVHQAHQMGVPFWTKVRMVWNIIVDWFIGLIPLIGDLFDVGWKSNRKNVALIKKALGLC